MAVGSLGMCLRDVLLGFFQVGAPYLHAAIKRGFSHTSEVIQNFFIDFSPSKKG
jgi:hypothetical protein